MTGDPFRKELSTLASQLVWNPSPSGKLGTGRLLIAGMGGSGLASEFAAKMLWGSQEVHVIRHHALPAWASAQDQVLCVSFSGNTWETLSVWGEAKARGMQRAAVSSGGTLAQRADAEGAPFCSVPDGLSPRSSLGYLIRAILSLNPGEPTFDFAGAADHINKIERAYSTSPDLAQALSGRVPVLMTWGDWSSLAATRWAGDLAENAKLPSILWRFPEAAHNSVMAFSTEAKHKLPIAPVLLGSAKTARGKEVMATVRGVLESRGVVLQQVASAHSEPWIDALGLAAAGTWTSIHLAELQGLDAGGLELLNRLKQELSS